jgi:hypothetical protein
MLLNVIVAARAVTAVDSESSSSVATPRYRLGRRPASTMDEFVRMMLIGSNSRLKWLQA